MIYEMTIVSLFNAQGRREAATAEVPRVSRPTHSQAGGFLGRIGDITTQRSLAPSTRRRGHRNEDNSRERGDVQTFLEFCVVWDYEYYDHRGVSLAAGRHSWHVEGTRVVAFSSHECSVLLGYVQGVPSARGPGF